MNKVRTLLAVALVIAAAGAAKATKARDFIGYINTGGAYIQVYVPYDCPNSGYGCTYTNWLGKSYQVYELSGLQFYPLKP